MIKYHQVRADGIAAFGEKRSSVLVCTDIASRGIDLEFVEHVVNFDFPKSAAQYVHRAGRTARVGRTVRKIVVNMFYIRNLLHLI